MHKERWGGAKDSDIEYEELTQTWTFFLNFQPVFIGS